MITSVIFINIENYHKNISIKINSVNLRFIFRYDNSCISLNNHTNKFIV